MSTVVCEHDSENGGRHFRVTLAEHEAVALMRASSSVRGYAPMVVHKLRLVQAIPGPKAMTPDELLTMDEPTTIPRTSRAIQLPEDES